MTGPPTHQSPSGRTSLLGVPIDLVTQKQAVAWICDRASDARGGVVVTVNLDHLRRCAREPAYAELVSRADLVVADGMPLIWASKVQGPPVLPERVAGSSMMIELCEAAAVKRIPVFFLGGDPGVAERAGQMLKERFPGFFLTGTYCPPFGFESDPEECGRIEGALAAASPGIVLVALGSPKQEYLADRLRHVLPRACWIGVGISLSFVTGDVRRAPVWIQKIGLEWLHRLCQEPRRLFRRYIIHGIPWAARLLGHSFLKRFAKDKPPLQASSPDPSPQRHAAKP
jgi:N-acetylglucosaminyldiphosphoundecaprenol N-acetyl-beta-D-mannosaminyltransferase